MSTTAARPAQPTVGNGTRQPGLLVVGHGSRRTEANDIVRAVAGELAERGAWHAVRAAFLEIAAPSLPAAFTALADAGCDLVVVHPFFLFPGSHTEIDVPRLVAEAAERNPGVGHVLTEPLAGHPGVLAAAEARIRDAAPAAPLTRSAAS